MLDTFDELDYLFAIAKRIADKDRKP